MFVYNIYVRILSHTPIRKDINSMVFIANSVLNFLFSGWPQVGERVSEGLRPGQSYVYTDILYTQRERENERERERERER